MDEKNFYFLGSNLRRNNAFFVSKKYEKERYFPNLKVTDISKNVDCNIRESRGLNGELTFLSGKNRIQEIENCEIINLENNIKIKIKDLLE